jgi:hypothetical protein
MLASGENDGPLPVRPIVVMQVAEFVTEAEHPHPIISPHLMTSREIDEQVDRVIADAETFRRLAKHELDIAQSRDRRR